MAMKPSLISSIPLDFDSLSVKDKTLVLHRRGETSDAIAANLGMSRGEVELIISLHDKEDADTPMASEFIELFLKDSTELLSAMRTGSLQARYEGGWADVARSLHSLKSGASFLGWSDVELEAHALEGVLSKSDGEAVDWNAAAETLKKLIDSAVTGSKKQFTAGGGVGRAVKVHRFGSACPGGLPYQGRGLLQTDLQNRSVRAFAVFESLSDFVANRNGHDFGKSRSPYG